MKKFSIKKAKAGEAVCTKDGRDVRILCFDRKSKNYPIVGLIDNNIVEGTATWDKEGKASKGMDCDIDLYMKEDKSGHTGYIILYPVNENIWNVYGTVYETEEEAEKACAIDENCIIKQIEWEEK